MKKKGGSGAGGCLGAPFRALSRACDSACDLYVRGMSRCARRVPAAMEAVAVGRGFGRSAPSMHLRVSSDTRRDIEDLVRAASRQRRVAAEPAAGQGAGAGKKGHYREAPAAVQAAGKKGLFQETFAFPAPRKKGVVMGTIAEDAPCEFVEDATLKATAPVRRGGAANGLAARAGGFGAIKVGTEVFAR
ncbi:hypothetical protein E2562_002985 [Oryza meyeriana var. granulata]|uniref:Uncharacterized protein n=1 Tax=Oryza meyeriana var. granulata TaxID=110450 RepID=A0A6G1DFN6_9ORYZ|nr:hypothetical protein E2562_002985 [Oryza meyeriana var. granulata]